MTLLYLIRHGETTWNLEGRFQGQMDSPLSEIGVLQAKALAQHFSRLHIDALYSSDLGRAKTTAEFISKENNCPIQLDLDLRERSFGIFEGMLREEAKVKSPDSYEAWSSGTFGEVVLGGESRQALCKRVVTSLERIVDQHNSKTVAVVTHGGVLSSLWRYLEPERTESLGFNIPNASISTMRRDNDRWKVLEWSNVNHLHGMRALNDRDNGYE